MGKINIKNINKKNIKYLYKKNEDIKYKEIILINEHGKQLGLVKLEEAIEISKNLNLDLVEINNKVFPPICKIINFNKFIYEKNRLIKEKKKRNKVIKIKEIKIKINIGTEDYRLKFNNIKKFIQNKKKVKITLKFRGREILHLDIALKIFDNIKNNLSEICNVDYYTKKIENKQIIMILSPNKNIK